MAKIVNKEQRRSEIARASIQVFAQKGFENATIQDIADAAGIGKGTVYQYFDRKEEILLQVAAEIFEEMENEIRALGESDMPVEEKIRALFSQFMVIADTMESFFLVYLEIWQIYMRAQRYGISMFVMNDMLIEYRKFLADIIEKGKEEGIFRDDIDSMSLSIFLIASLDGVAFHYYINRKSMDIKKVCNDFLDSFLRGIKK